MNKKLIALAVAGILASPLAVQAENSATLSGFADIIYTHTNESTDSTTAAPTASGDNTTERKFTADGEIDFIGTMDNVTVRVDVDLTLSGNSSGRLEQALFAWNTGPVTVIGGVFNNPIGYEAEDAPDMDFTTHSAIWNILDHQTALDGNNIAGVALAGSFGPVTVTGAVLNDLQQVDEENSFALVANIAPVKGLAIELGYVTQENDDPTAGGAGNVWDINATYSIAGFTAGVDYLKPEEVVESAFNVFAGYDFGNGFGAKVRYEQVEWDLGNTDDTTATTLYASYAVAKNLSVALEHKIGDVDTANRPTTTAVAGINDGDLTTLEFIATF